MLREPPEEGQLPTYECGVPFSAPLENQQAKRLNYELHSITLDALICYEELRILCGLLRVLGALCGLGFVLVSEPKSRSTAKDAK